LLQDWSALYVNPAGQTSHNFVVGLTNTSSDISPPTLRQYTVCGEYPGTVPAGATVTLRCNNADLPPARYVIVQLPVMAQLRICDLNVCTKGIADVLKPIPYYLRRGDFLRAFLSPL